MNQNNQNNQNNTYDENIILISLLNTMYTNNIQQIQSLNEMNNEILNIVNNTLLQRRNNNTNRSNRNRNNNTNNTDIINNTNNTHIISSLNRFNNRNRNRNNNINRSNNINRPNNTPYIIDSVIEYTIPITNNQLGLNENLPETIGNSLPRIFQNFLEPIEVFPTPTQIEQATRNIRYCDIIRPLNRSCPISLERFNDTDMVTIIRECRHIFNTSQLNTWFTSNCRCPVCRYDIRNFNININRSEIISDEIVEEENVSNTNQSTISNLLEQLLDPSNNTINTLEILILFSSASHK